MPNVITFKVPSVHQHMHHAVLEQTLPRNASACLCPCGSSVMQRCAEEETHCGPSSLSRVHTRMVRTDGRLITRAALPRHKLVESTKRIETQSDGESTGWSLCQHDDLHDVWNWSNWPPGIYQSCVVRTTWWSCCQHTDVHEFVLFGNAGCTHSNIFDDFLARFEHNDLSNAHVYHPVNRMICRLRMISISL